MFIVGARFVAIIRCELGDRLRKTAPTVPPGLTTADCGYSDSSRPSAAGVSATLVPRAPGSGLWNDIRCVEFKLFTCEYELPNFTLPSKEPPTGDGLRHIILLPGAATRVDRLRVEL